MSAVELCETNVDNPWRDCLAHNCTAPSVSEDPAEGSWPAGHMMDHGPTHPMVGNASLAFPRTRTLPWLVAGVYHGMTATEQELQEC